MANFDFIRILEYLPGIILGLTVHEFSHAFIALKCGDSTARDMGRVSLNPIKHIDPLGFLLLIIAGFGWAKPVQFNESMLRNPRKDVIKIALAGPLSNAILAMLLSVLYILLTYFFAQSSFVRSLVFNEVFSYAIVINWGLMVFNLIPIPPLDGSHFITHPLRKHPALYQGLYRYGTLVLFGILMIDSFLKIQLLPIVPVIRFLYSGFFSLVSFVLPGL
jgi:Zn-dependent proteases